MHPARGTEPDLEGEAPARGGGLSAGALLFGEGAAPIRENVEGRTTSACFSPTLGGWIALALLSDGPARWGERVRVLDRMRGLETLAEVCDPAFYDPEGARARD